MHPPPPPPLKQTVREKLKTVITKYSIINWCSSFSEGGMCVNGPYSRVETKWFNETMQLNDPSFDKEQWAKKLRLRNLLSCGLYANKLLIFKFIPFITRIYILGVKLMFMISGWLAVIKHLISLGCILHIFSKKGIHYLTF